MALAIGNHISSWARFFASLRYAQNDKLLYVFANKGLMIISAIVLVSLSILVFNFTSFLNNLVNDYSI